jgi:hypothetical protein
MRQSCAGSSQQDCARNGRCHVRRPSRLVKAIRTLGDVARNQGGRLHWTEKVRSFAGKSGLIISRVRYDTRQTLLLLIALLTSAFSQSQNWTAVHTTAIMVGTRNHPRDFVPPLESPVKSTRRKTRSTEPEPASTTLSATLHSPKPHSNQPTVITSTMPSSSSLSTKPLSKASSMTSPSNQVRTTPFPDSSSRRRDAPLWCHTPPPIAFPWLVLSLPLVLWDTVYIMGRPHTFAGGAIAWPLYVPYELYGRVDPVYSVDAYYNGLGWTGAQGLGNVFETLAYVAYIYIVVAYGRNEGRAEGILGSLGAVGRKRRVYGHWGAIASLVSYTTFMVTVAKSVLYCKYGRYLALSAELLTVPRVQ